MVSEQTIGTDRAINLGDRVLVASATTPGQWYEVAEGRCECKGFRYRQRCRHLLVAGRFAGPNLCAVCGLSAESLDDAGWCPSCAHQFAGVVA